MDESPVVSILVPAYNVSTYIRQCLNSIIKQTLANIEIICINDGSTDDTLRILKEYEKNDPRIKVIDKENTGYGNSMNIAIENATGKYIGIVESDDFVEPNMFERLYDEAVRNDLDVSRCNFYYHITENGEDIKSNLNWIVHDEIYAPDERWEVFYQQPSVWANLYKTSFLRENKIKFLETPGASYQDTAFTFKVYSLASRFKIIPDPLIHYRVDSEGSSTTTATTKVYCICDEYDEIKRFTKENGTYEKYKKLIIHLQYRGYKWNYERLAEPYNQQFLERWKEEFLDEYNRGNIDRKRFSTDEYEDVLRIIFRNEDKGNANPIVSIIIPVYNVSEYLHECLDSVINQTFSDIEIICVNDGSTDDSLSILQKYATEDNRIVIIDKSNGGLSSARNAGLELSKGKYVNFIDSDDFIELDTIESAVNRINGADAVFYGTNIFGDAMTNRRKTDEEYYRIKFTGFVELDTYVRSNTDVSAWNKLFRKSIIDKYNIKFPDKLLFEDYSFYWKYVFCCKNVYYLPDKKYNYRRREGSIMNKVFAGSSKSMDHLFAAEVIFNFAYMNNIVEIYENDLASIFKNCFQFAYRNVNKRYKKKVLKESANLLNRIDMCGDSMIESLRNYIYTNIEGVKPTSYKGRIQRLFQIFIDKFRINGSRNISWTSSTPRNPFDSSEHVATTRWVHNHEHSSGIDRWRIIFNSSDLQTNRGYLDGIPGGEAAIFRDLNNTTMLNQKIRFFVSFHEMNPIILSSEVNRMGKLVLGTMIYHKGIISITIEMDLSSGFLQVTGLNLTDNRDCSKYCKLIKIDITF